MIAKVRNEGLKKEAPWLLTKAPSHSNSNYKKTATLFYNNLAGNL